MILPLRGHGAATDQSRTNREPRGAVCRNMPSLEASMTSNPFRSRAVQGCFCGFGAALLLATVAASQPLSAHQNARVREAAIVPSRVIVVFTSNTLPTDAAARVQKAGGRLIRTLGPVGIAIVVPVSVDGSTLIRKLRRDPAIFNAEYDRVVNLIAPAQ